MRILAIVPSIYNTSPGQRYRIEQWEGLLKNLGVEIDYAPFESEELNACLYKDGNILRKSQLVVSSVINRLQALSKIKNYDLVYIFREACLVGPAFFEKMVKRRRIPIVYDFDDAIYLPNVSASNARFGFLKFPGKVADTCRAATEVMVGNNVLAEYANQFNGNVTVVPSTIDTVKYFPKTDYAPNADLTIVWSGSTTTLPHLETLGSSLQKLARKERFKLLVIGAVDFHLEGVEVENIRWNAETEADDLRRGDIGIMPLPDDEWSRGKCGMKALQYMGMGIPTVCSAVGANMEIIRNGENGFLAKNEDGWMTALGNLIHSVELRSRLGKQGRVTVDQKYSAEVQAPKVFEVFEQAVNAKSN